MGLNTPSPGSERRLAWISRRSRTPRGAIADWEEEPLLRGSPGADMPGTPDPRGALYCNLSPFLPEVRECIFWRESSLWRFRFRVCNFVVTSVLARRLVCAEVRYGLFTRVPKAVRCK